MLDEVDVDSASVILSVYLQHSLDLLSSNLLYLLHVPVAIVAPGTYTQHLQHTLAIATKHRIKNNKDLFDSEDSDSETEKESKSNTQPNNMCPKTKRTMTEDERTLGSCIDHLSQLYDTMSFSDSYLTCTPCPERGCSSRRTFDLYPGHVYPGLSDNHLVCDTLPVGRNEDTVRQTQAMVGSIPKVFLSNAVPFL